MSIWVYVFMSLVVYEFMRVWVYGVECFVCYYYVLFIMKIKEP